MYSWISITILKQLSITLNGSLKYRCNWFFFAVHAEVH